MVSNIIAHFVCRLASQVFCARYFLDTHQRLPDGVPFVLVQGCQMVRVVFGFMNHCPRPAINKRQVFLIFLELLANHSTLAGLIFLVFWIIFFLVCLSASA